MSVSTSDWTVPVSRAVIDGNGARQLIEHLDDLLRWITKKPGPNSERLDELVKAEGYPVDLARRQALTLLDQTLFLGSNNPYEVLGLAPNADTTTVRNRYKRLTQVFHPDKGLGDREWLNDRMDRIRTAYEDIVSPGSARPNARRDAYEQTRARPRRPRSRAGMPTVRTNINPAAMASTPPRMSTSGELRRSLGTAKSFKRRIMGILVVACSAYAGLLYLSHTSEDSVESFSQGGLKDGSDGVSLSMNREADATLSHGSVTVISDRVTAASEGEAFSAGASHSSSGSEASNATVAGSPAIHSMSHDNEVARLEPTTSVEPQTMTAPPDRVSVSVVTAHEAQNGERESVVSEDSVSSADRVAADIAEPFESLMASANTPALVAQRIVGELAQAFVLGDVKGIASIYGQDARENALTGRKEIGQYYQQVFDRSSRRYLAFELVTATSVNERIEVEAVFNFVLVRSDTDQPEKHTRLVSLSLTRSDSGYQIHEMLY